MSPIKVLNASHVETLKPFAVFLVDPGRRCSTSKKQALKESTMKVWSKPQVREQEVGLEVTSYLPAEIDII